MLILPLSLVHPFYYLLTSCSANSEPLLENLGPCNTIPLLYSRSKTNIINTMKLTTLILSLTALAMASPETSTIGPFGAQAGIDCTTCFENVDFCITVITTTYHRLHISTNVVIERPHYRPVGLRRDLPRARVSQESGGTCWR